MAKRYRDLILLHSNDMHGDFLSENVDEKLLGGISMLSGYVSKVKLENPHTLYCIAGDMLQGSLIDTEFKGISTIEIMNLLNPDIVSLGNHEIDYGVAHLLFLERCAKFPIVNANLFIKQPFTRLFSSHKIIKINNMKVMFIGIITEEVMSSIRLDKLLGTLIDVEEAVKEVGMICNAHRTIDIDFTVLLTHIGFEEDKQLAALLDPDWGVDVIIGGHSHTILEKPEKVNDVMIVQAGVGTNQIGRFDIVVDTKTNSIKSYKWELVQIDSKHCPRDFQLEETVLNFKQQIDGKYDRILTKFAKPLTHPNRFQETELGNLMCDALKKDLNVDIIMLGSGSIRKTKVDTILTLGILLEIMPYDDKLLLLKVSGDQFKKIIKYMLRDDNLIKQQGEFYQFSEGLAITYNSSTKEFEKFKYNGKPLDDEDILSVGIQDYHYKNFGEFLGIELEELVNGKGKVLTTSLFDVLLEHFTTEIFPYAEVEGRLTITT